MRATSVWCRSARWRTSTCRPSRRSAFACATSSAPRSRHGCRNTAATSAPRSPTSSAWTRSSPTSTCTSPSCSTAFATIRAKAVEQLGEVHVEVGEERVHADDVGERGAEVAAVFLHPCLERGALEVAQANAERLEGLQVLVRHRADRHQTEVARIEHVGGALEELRHFALQDG